MGHSFWNPHKRGHLWVLRGLEAVTAETARWRRAQNRF